MKIKVLIIVVSIIVVITALLVNSVDNPLPIAFSEINKIELYDLFGFDENGTPYENEQYKLITFEEEDVTFITGILEKARNDGDSSLSCPFGIVVLLYTGNESVTLEFGTDDCGFVIFKNKYYRLPEQDFKALQDFLLQQGINIHHYI